MRVMEVTTQGTQGTNAPSNTPDTNQQDTAQPNNGSTIGQAQTEPTSDTMGDGATPAEKRQQVQKQIKDKNDQIIQTRDRAKAAQDEIAAAREAEKLANEELALLRKRLSSIR